MLLGLHCPVLRGFLPALKRAEDLGCEALQILPYRRHRDPALEGADAFREARSRGCVRRLLLHSRFVPSLASSDDKRRERSIELLAAELALIPAWGAEAFVLHVGAYSPEATAQEGLKRGAEAMAESVKRARCAAPLCLENVPGGGRRLGGTLEEIAEMRNALERLGVNNTVCLDTAHAWAAGYDLASAEGMLVFLARVHRILGSENVKVFHLNDTRALLGSHREHHWHWGKGYLGSEGLRTLLERPEYESALGILETPPGPEDEVNLEYVRSLRIS